MKKYFILIIMCLGVLFFSGCSLEKEKTMTCTRTANQNGVSINITHKVTYKGKYVLRVDGEEIVISDDSEYMSGLKEQVDNLYSNYEGIDNYKVETKLEGNTLTSKTNIDYEHIDMEKFKEIDSSVSLLLTDDNKIEVDTIEKTYNSLGETCER